MIELVKSWHTQYLSIEEYKKEASAIEKVAHDVLFKSTTYLSNTMHYTWSVVSHYYGKISSVFFQLFQKKFTQDTQPILLQPNSEVFKEVVAGFDKMLNFYQEQVESLNTDITQLAVENDKHLGKIKAIHEEIEQSLICFEDLKKDYDLKTEEIEQLDELIAQTKAIQKRLTRKIEENPEKITEVLKIVQQGIENQGIDKAPLQDLIWYIGVSNCLKKYPQFLQAYPMNKEFELRVRKTIDFKSFTTHTKAPVIAGIPQIGNSCYIASTVQAFRSSSFLRKKLDQPLQQKYKESNEAFEERKKIQLALQNLVKSVEANERDAITFHLSAFRQAVFQNKHINSDLSTWKGVYKKEKGQDKSTLVEHVKKSKDPTRNQHDASQLMTLLLDVIDYSIDVQKKIWVDNYPYNPPKVEPVHLLHIELHEDTQDLSSLINEAFCKKKEATPYKLEVDGQEIGRFEEFNSQQKLLGEPEVIVVHLKRFAADLTKLTYPVELPENLQINLMHAFGKSEPIIYNAVGTVNHAGSLGGGHYIANIKQDNWFECDDSAVNEISTVQEDDHSRKGKGFQKYMIILQRVKDE